MTAYLIYMSVRVMEMKRVLKDTGSIYLHCDPTASHYLKLMMDEVFGRKNFRNEIAWKRSNPKNDSVTRFGKIGDRILFYSFHPKSTWNPPYEEHTKEHVEKSYKHEDERGRFMTAPLHVSSGQTGRGYDYEFHGHFRTWVYPLESMKDLEAEGRVYLPKKRGGVPRKKVYLHETKGRLVCDMIMNIPLPKGTERTEYPTQKPLKLLERLISASSNSGDMVLDPFCGCATTCIAAEKLGCQWIGIDISAKAMELVKSRLRKDLGLFSIKVTHRTDIPSDRVGTRSRDIKHLLFGKQEGFCNGCGVSFHFRNFTLDHIVPKDKGGSDTDDNLQLLCGYCNSVKGNRTQEYLLAKLTEDNVIGQGSFGEHLLHDKGRKKR